ncbi:MAG TPA: hypothetical protein VET30_04475 [Pseudoxanthomonas sp.]|nr:hypothetical protein [Pseudoxanthomonas sp.]
MLFVTLYDRVVAILTSPRLHGWAIPLYFFWLVAMSKIMAITMALLRSGRNG